MHRRRAVAALAPLILLGAAGPIAAADTTDTTSAAAASTLVMDVVIKTSNPHPGTKISAQVWAGATGTSATNATLALSSNPSATISPTCTLSGGKCMLGNLDAKGVTIQLTITAPSKTGTLTLKATLAADNVTGTDSGTATTTITKASTSATPTTTVTVTTTTRTTATATTTTTPAAVVTPPSVAPTAAPTTQVPSPIAALPAITPAATEQAAIPPTSLTDGRRTPTKLAATGTDGDVPYGLAAGEGAWLACLLFAIGLTAGFLHRRRARHISAALAAARPTGVGPAAAPGKPDRPKRLRGLMMFFELAVHSQNQDTEGAQVTRSRFLLTWARSRR